MAELQRKKGESFEAFLRRFNRALKNSGRLTKARQAIYRVDKKTKRKQKENAIFGIKLRKEREYLRKTGKLKEENSKRW